MEELYKPPIRHDDDGPHRYYATHRYDPREHEHAQDESLEAEWKIAGERKAPSANKRERERERSAHCMPIASGVVTPWSPVVDESCGTTCIVLYWSHCTVHLCVLRALRAWAVVGKFVAFTAPEVTCVFEFANWRQHRGLCVSRAFAIGAHTFRLIAYVR